MDPLTTLLAAAAATGPNTLQSQALTALRSAGPQESFFTRMGNPHPLQLQQLAQPTTPQLNPIITQPTMAPTALTQPLPMPMIAATGQPSTSYDANNAADSGHTATSNDAKRPGGVHPGQFSHTHPKAAGRFGTAGDAGPASAAQQCAQYSTTRRADNGRETCAEHGIGPHAARQHYIPPFEGRTRHQLRPSSEPHAAPRRERQTRRLPSQDCSRSHTRPQHRCHRRSAHHLRHGRGRDGVLLRMHLGSRHWPPWHLIRRLSETQRPRSQDRGDGAGAGHGGLWERYPRPMVEL